MADGITIVNDQRFTWKGREKLSVRPGNYKFGPGYQLTSYVQLEPPVAPTSLDLRSDWRLYALGTSYGFYLYDYSNKQSVVNKCTLNVQDFAIVSGDASGTGAMSRKKSFRKSLRESFRRLRRGRSQRQAGGIGTDQTTAAKAAFSRVTTGVRTLNAPSGGADSGSNINTPVGVHRAVTYSTERQVEQKVELSSIVKCLTLTSAIITNNPSFKPTLWVGTNSGQVLVYAINLASEQQKSEVATEQQQATDQQDSTVATVPSITAKLVKEIQLRHKAPIIAIFTTPEAPAQPQHLLNASGESEVTEPEKQVSELLTPASDYKATDSKEAAAAAAAKSSGGEESEQAAGDEGRATSLANQQQQPQKDSKSPTSKQSMKEKEVILQPRVLICSEEQFKVFNLPNLKPFCKFKLTAHEGLRAKKISITQFLKPAISNKQQHQQSSSSSLSASKSLQSFATQTSPPASPLPPAAENENDSSSAATAAAAAANGANKQTENNNNSLSTLNNNHTASGAKELMNAKFGAKSSTASGASQFEQKELGEQQADSSLFEPYMVCMSNQGDCAIYSVPDLKRQAQIQVCKREDVNGITSTMLTNYGEGYYLRSSSNFLRFSISTQRVLRVLSVV